MSKEQYDNLLKLLSEMSTEYHSEYNYDLSEDSDSLQTLKFNPFPEPLPEYPFGPYYTELIIILKSDIFHDGKIKGRKLSGGSNIYKNYQIIDLEKFIWLLCDKIHSFGPVDGEGRIIYNLSNLLEAIKECGDSISRLFGKREGKKLTAFSGKVTTWLSTMKKLSKNSPPQFIITEQELADQVTDIFKKHIPNAPEETIYVGVCNFLKLFDVNCRPKTLAMRNFRRRKAHLVK